LSANLIWYVAGTIAALAIGWAAAAVHASGNAPLGITSVGVGIALGAVLGMLAASQRLAGVRPLIAGTLLLAIVTVLAEHAWLYLDFRRQWHESRAESSQVAMFRDESPPPPGKYFARKLTAERAALWIVDAAIVIATATGTVTVMQRQVRQKHVAREPAESPTTES
jgi:hypothetical protein